MSDDIMSRVIRETTADWLACFSDAKAAGDELADSIFWRLALHCLPEGVDGNDPRVAAALEEIRASVRKTGRDLPA